MATGVIRDGASMAWPMQNIPEAGCWYYAPSVFSTIFKDGHQMVNASELGTEPDPQEGPLQVTVQLDLCDGSAERGTMRYWINERPLTFVVRGIEGPVRPFAGLVRNIINTPGQVVLLEHLHLSSAPLPLSPSGALQPLPWRHPHSPTPPPRWPYRTLLTPFTPQLMLRTASPVAADAAAFGRIHHAGGTDAAAGAGGDRPAFPTPSAPEITL